MTTQLNRDWNPRRTSNEWPFTGVVRGLGPSTAGVRRFQTLRTAGLPCKGLSASRLRATGTRRKLACETVKAEHWQAGDATTRYDRRLEVIFVLTRGITSQRERSRGSEPGKGVTVLKKILSYRESGKLGET